MLTLLYLCGPPGAGKSTLMAELTRRCERHPQHGIVPHDVLARDGRPAAAEIGTRRDGGFPGTDALSMSIAPAARQWIATVPYRTVLAEGRRLASLSFLEEARTAGYQVTLGYLNETRPGLLAERRQLRGSAQSEAWVRGSATAAANLADNAIREEFTVLRMDAAATPAELAETLILAAPALEVLA